MNEPMVRVTAGSKFFSFAIGMVAVAVACGSANLVGAREALTSDRSQSENAVRAPLRYYEWRASEQGIGDAMDATTALSHRGYDGVLFEVGGLFDATEQANAAAIASAKAQWRARMRRFANAAIASGLSIHAVSGDPGWVQPDRAYVGAALAKEVALWNQTEPEKYRFDSLQFDIEPPQDKTYGQSVKALLRIVEQIAEVPGVPPLEVAVPVRIAEVEIDDKGRTGAAALGDLARRYGISISIMAYRDQADGDDGSLDLVARVRRQLGSNVHIRVVQEVGQPIGDHPKTSHANKGRKSLVTSLARIENVLGDDSYLDGMDVNDSVGALALR